MSLIRSIRQAVAIICATLVLGFAVGTWAAERQPHMIAALRALRNAKQQLEAAEHDKGGHRAKALQLVNDAIAEVQRGIDFDKKH